MIHKLQISSIYIYFFFILNPERLLVFKALRVGPQMHQSTSPTPTTLGPSMGAIWKISLFLRLYDSVDECTSPLVEHLLRMDHHVCNPEKLLVFRALRVGRVGQGGLTNERPRTDHVIWGQIRGLKKNCMGRGQTNTQRDTYTDIATTWPNRPSGSIPWKLQHTK